MGPRTFLVETLPPVRAGERIAVRPADVRVTYDPALPAEKMNPRWKGLVAEWGDFLAGELSDLQEPVIRRAWNELVGLGPGSTPAGDDFLSGLAAGMLWQGEDVPFHPVPGLTSWLSGEMLRDAFAGGIWFRAKRLLRALASEDPGAVTGSAGSIADWGQYLRPGLAGGACGSPLPGADRISGKGGETVPSSHQRIEIVRRTYYDSVTLMLVAKELLKDGSLSAASLSMGTEANYKILGSGGFDLDGVDATPNDLIIAIKTDAPRRRESPS